MAGWDGAGNFTPQYVFVTDAANGINILASRQDTQWNLYATGLMNCLTRDGQTKPSANTPWNNFKITGLANGTAATDSVAYGQIGGAFFDAGNSGAAISIAWASGNNQKVTLNANTVITLGDGVNVGWYSLRLVQDGVGGRTFTWAGTNYSAARWAGLLASPTLSTAIGIIYQFNFFWDGTIWWQYLVGPLGNLPRLEYGVARGGVSALGSISGSVNLDWNAFDTYTATIGGATTFTETNRPGSTTVGNITLALTNPGAFTVNWPASWKWPAGVAPTRTVSGLDIYVALCYDATTVHAAQSMKDSR